MRRFSALFIAGMLGTAVAACAGNGGASSEPSLILPPTPSASAKATTSTTSTTPSSSTMASTSPGASASMEASASPSASVPAGPNITVTAVDYQFTNMPTSAPVGTTLSLQNSGTEVHEMVVVRKNDGVTQSWDELLQMPEAEVGQYITILSGAIAAPGTTSDTTVQLIQEGDYLMICFVPQGTYSLPPASMEPGASGGLSSMEPMASAAPSMAAESPSSSMAAGSPGTGIPHFMLGMEQEFMVTAAGSTPGPIPSPQMSPGSSMMPGESMAPASSAGTNSY